MEIVEKQLYVAEIVDQGFALDKEGDPFFKLFFRIKGKVNDKYNPDNNTPVDSLQEYEIQFRFKNAMPNIIEWRLGDLQKLGLVGEDLSVLDPNHEPEDQRVSFVGKKVIVSPTIKESGDRKNIYWNLVFPKKDTKKVDKSQINKLNDLVKKSKEASTKAEAELPSFD
jgi:hypothetical protein